VTATSTADLETLNLRIARVIIDRLQLEGLTAETFPKEAILFAKEHQGGMGFDSIGSLEIAAGLADEFDLELDDISEQDFMTVQSLAGYIGQQLGKATA
jgi:acyl carrier protein